MGMASAADLARVKAIMATSTNANIGLFPAEAYRAIVDGRFVNTGEVHVRGLDLQAAYDWTWRGDRWAVTADASYLADYVRRFTPTAPAVQLVGTPNQPVDLRARLSGSWTHGPFGLSASLAYVDAYRSETRRRIDPWTPVDVQARWSPDEAGRPWSGLSLALNVQNLFDLDPPFYDAPSGLGFDPANADPLGRVLVADTRGGQLLVFGVDPLIERQAYPVPQAPYGLAGSRNLAWVSQTATNSVVGYDLSTGIPVEKVRYRTVQQPDVLAFDERTGTLFVVSGSGAGVQMIVNAGPH